MVGGEASEIDYQSNEIDNQSNDIDNQSYQKRDLTAMAQVCGLVFPLAIPTSRQLVLPTCVERTFDLHSK